jgi:hypothetical protein
MPDGVPFVTDPTDIPATVTSATFSITHLTVVLVEDKAVTQHFGTPWPV